MKRLMIVALASVCWHAPLGAQQPSSEPVIKIKSSTELVLIPAVVNDKDGHVANLTKDDFTVLENGRQQKISVFEEVKTTTERIPRPQLGPGEFANLNTADIRRLTFIALDMINTGTIELARVRDELLTFLDDAVAADEPVGIVALLPNGIRVLHDITTDKKVLQLGLQMYKSHAPAKAGSIPTALAERPPEAIGAAETEEEADSLARALEAWGNMKEGEQKITLAQHRNARLSTLEALQQMAQMLSGIPGRKTVIWASSSFPFGDLFSTSGGLNVHYNMASCSGTDLDYVAYTWRLLNQANIAIYPVDARGLVNTAFDVISPDRKYSPSYADKQGAQSQFQDSITTFENIAAATGGRPCYGRTDLHNCFEEAIQDSHAYYVLGYYVDRSKKPAPGWKKLEVRVRAKGAKVRARGGFFLSPDTLDPSALRKTDVATALGSPLSYSGLSFRGHWLETTPKGPKKSVRYELRLPSNSISVDPGDGNHINLEFVAVATDKDGKSAATTSQTVDRKLPAQAVGEIMTQGITYRNSLELDPGMYLVHFVVRDNLTQHTGSIVIPLNVQ